MCTLLAYSSLLLINLVVVCVVYCSLIHCCSASAGPHGYMATSRSPALLPPRVDLDRDPRTVVCGTQEWLRCDVLVRVMLEAHGCMAVGCRNVVLPELLVRLPLLE